MNHKRAERIKNEKQLNDYKEQQRMQWSNERSQEPFPKQQSSLPSSQKLHTKQSKGCIIL